MEPQAAALVSGEGVRLALAPAGVGSRVIATLIDVVVQAVALFGLLLLDVAAAGSADGAAIAAVVLVEAVLVLAGYPIICEWLTQGRTLGKLVLGLRVVRDDGGPIGFRQALVRGLSGLVLEKPGLAFPLTTVAGLVTMSSSAREKRIGDMMAGTVVLNERSAPQSPAAAPAWVAPPLQPWAASLDLHRLDDSLALVVRRFVTRANGMTPAARDALGENLRRRVFTVVAPPPPAGTPTPLVLLTVLAERRRRAGGPPATYPPPVYGPPPYVVGPVAAGGPVSAEGQRPPAPPSRADDSPFTPPR